MRFWYYYRNQALLQHSKCEPSNILLPKCKLCWIPVLKAWQFLQSSRPRWWTQDMYHLFVVEVSICENSAGVHKFKYQPTSTKNLKRNTLPGRQFLFLYSTRVSTQVWFQSILILNIIYYVNNFKLVERWLWGGTRLPSSVSIQIFP